MLGSSIAGSFSQASIVTNVATGDVVLNSSTPVELTVQISGITTVVADVAQGNRCTGIASSCAVCSICVTSCNNDLFEFSSQVGRQCDAT